MLIYLSPALPALTIPSKYSAWTLYIPLKWFLYRDHIMGDRGKGLTLSLTSKVHCGGWGKWAVVLWTISLKEAPGLTFLRYCFHKMVPELLSIPKSWAERHSKTKVNKNTSLTFKYCILSPSMTRKKSFSPYPKLPQNTLHISSRHSTQAYVEMGEIQCWDSKLQPRIRFLPWLPHLSWSSDHHHHFLEVELISG